MTQIIALRHKNKVYVGSDRALVEGYKVSFLSYSKVKTVGKFTVGYAGDSEAIATLEQQMSWPTNFPHKDPHSFLVTELIPRFRDTLGIHEVEQNDVDVLLVFGPNIVKICNLRDINIIQEESASIGICPDAPMILQATVGTPTNRLKKTLSIIAEHMPSAVLGPFDITVTEVV